jgi:predicted LPLAT superfamily acyltransferase
MLLLDDDLHVRFDAGACVDTFEMRRRKRRHNVRALEGALNHYAPKLEQMALYAHEQTWVREFLTSLRDSVQELKEVA